MNSDELMQQMRHNAQHIRSLVEGISEEQARWKPDADSWSILEVVNHLYDEEREDFRARLDIMLHRPEETWTAIDPQGWVKEREYNQRDLEASLGNFLEERRVSLAWLAELETPSWDAAYEASFGVIHAGDMFAAWVTHDQLHLRQLVELQRAYTEQLAAPYQLDYAGAW